MTTFDQGAARGRLIILTIFVCGILGMFTSCAQVPPQSLETSDRLLLTDLKWLDPLADRVVLLTRQRPEPPSRVPLQQGLVDEIGLGRIAFRNPGLLGGVAAREGLSCQTCHPSGLANEAFYLAGLSSGPGNVDTTTSVFSKVLGDGVNNPIAIPSLEAVADTAPYGHDNRQPSLETFVRTVIVDEFSGRIPAPVILKALVTYVGSIGRATPGAPTEAITVATEMAELMRSVDVLKSTIRDKDLKAGTFVIFALRHQLGRMHERFNAVPLHEPRDILKRWSDDLRAIRDFIEVADFGAAMTRLADWRNTAAIEQKVLAQWEPDSLYNPEILKVALADH